MTEKCFDIGTIQAFLDGELAADRLESVSRHIALCDGCAILLAEAEEETAFAFSALESEFNGFVPTNRLWAKINDSIEKEKRPFWQTVFARFSNPSVAAFASLAIVVGLFAVVFVKTDDSNKLVAVNNPDNQVTTSPIFKEDVPQLVTNKPEIRNAGTIKVSSPVDDKNEPRVIKATFSEKENSQQPIKSQKPNTIINRNVKSLVEAESNSNEANLLGEESYVKTIATLTKTVNTSKDEVLKPSARFAFERDLAVTDDAIKKMKAEVKKNPKNEAAKEVLRASYQNKIDLLSSVAEKSELMASIK